MNNFARLLSTAAAVLILPAFLLIAETGCGSHVKSLSAGQSNAFESAPADVKQTWEKALTADRTDDYVNAQIYLDSLNRTILSDSQRKALETESASFGLRLTQAVDKNDPAAVKAVQEINQARRQRK